MKTIIFLLAVLAMIGFASAWDTTEQMQYVYQKLVNTQAGQNLEWMNGAKSSASYQSNTAYGQSNAAVSNTLVSTYAPIYQVGGYYTGTWGDTNDSLTQTGGATTTTSAPDLESPADTKISGQATTSTDLHLSGNYGGAECTNVNTEALFSQHAAVGVGSINVVGQTNNPGTYDPNTGIVSDDWPHTTGDSAGNPTAEPWSPPYWGSPYENPFSAAIRSASGNQYVDTGTNWIEADLGQSTTAGFEQIQAEGALPTMSGSSSAYAGFSGAYNLNAGQMPQIETMVADSTGFGMFSNWGSTGTFTGTNV